MRELTQEMRQCIENCQACHSICLSMAAIHCLETGGKHVAPEHIRTMLDCAQICQTSADFMLRSSSYHKNTCRACAEICEACAASCDEMWDLTKCADAWRKCSASCRQMSRTAA